MSYELVLSIVKAVSENWEPCELAIESYRKVQLPLPEISFNLSSDGLAQNIKICRTTGIVATDLSCLDAVLTSLPFRISPQFSTSTFGLVKIDFFYLKYDATGKWAARGQRDSARGSYGRREEKWHCLEDRFMKPHRFTEPMYPIHLLPPSVLHRYPGVLSEAEIHCESNIRMLKIGSAESLMRQIREDFREFFCTAESTTREDLSALAGRVDAKYHQAFDDGCASFRTACNPPVIED